MRILHIAFTTLALALTTAAAEAAVLDFEGVICGGPCGNGTAIEQTYGDIAGVDVVYDGNPGQLGLEGFAFWSTAYSDLSNVAYYGRGAELSFLGLGGSGVFLDSLDLGAWPNADRQLGFTVTDLLNGNQLFDTGLVTVSGAIRSSFNLALQSTVGLKVTFLGDFYNGGVDNIVYGATEPPVPPIPLPASAFLMIGGLAGLAALRRRRA